MVSEPIQIRAVDLAGGNLLWKQPIRDLADRRPPPM
jgi:hypothetical protein